MKFRLLLISVLMAGCTTVQPVSHERVELNEGEETAAAVGKVTMFKHLIQLVYRVLEGAAVITGIQEVRKESQK